MKTVRMRALQDFSRRIAGHIVVGNPDHPSDEGRYPVVPAECVEALEDADLAEVYSEADQARDEAEADQRDAATPADGAKDPADGLKSGAVKEVVKALTGGVERRRPRAPKDTLTAGSRKTSQEVRDQRTDTGAKGNGGRRRKPASAPVGGNETTASTNHGSMSVAGGGTTDGTNNGASGLPAEAEDAAPTE